MSTTIPLAFRIHLTVALGEVTIAEITFGGLWGIMTMGWKLDMAR